MRVARRYFEPGRFVWTDVQKTQAELRPTKMIHRACELLGEFENMKAPDERRLLEKKIPGRFIRLGLDRMLYIR